MAEMERSSTFLRDVVARYPQLRDRPGIADGSAWPVCIVVGPIKCHLASSRWCFPSTRRHA
jgi:hypothetical protein